MCPWCWSPRWTSRADRVAGLEAGADDFLTKPIDDVVLFARVRSLVRLKMMTDELRMRESTGQGMGLIDPAETLTDEQPSPAACW